MNFMILLVELGFSMKGFVEIFENPLPPLCSQTHPKFQCSLSDNFNVSDLILSL